MSEDRPTEDQLRLTARRGSGLLERALGIVLLARRRDRVDRLHAFLEEHGDTAD